MTESQTLTTANKIFQAVFGRDNPYTLAELRQKFAFDITLPVAVKDTTTGEITYTAMPNAQTFMTEANTHKYDNTTGWMRPKRPVKDLKQLLAAWSEINYTTTERVYESENVSCSDPIYNSENVYCSTNCGKCQYLIFGDGTYNSSYTIACQRSTNVNFCIRVDDSNSCTNSCNVICSGKISNSFFIQDCNALHECIFCSHLANQKFCIANMQFSEDEYFCLKQQIIDWILK